MLLQNLETENFTNNDIPPDAGPLSNISRNSEENLYLEDSDDSVKDRNYQPASDSSSSLLDEADVATEAVEEETEILAESEVHKGRPKKGRKRKYAGQDRKIRKKNCNSNTPYYSAKSKFANRNFEILNIHARINVI